MTPLQFKQLLELLERIASAMERCAPKAPEEPKAEPIKAPAEKE